MSNILCVGDAMSIFSKLEKYTNDGLIDPDYLFFAVEFFGKKIPENLPANCFPVKDFLDQNELNEVCARIRERGIFSSVISIDETTLYTAAEFRKRLNCPGPSKNDLERFRDKVVMKGSLSGSGIRVPTIYSADDLKSGRVPFPLVAKPRAYCGSIGVQILRSQQEVESLLFRSPAKKNDNYDTSFPELSLDDLEFEEFIEGPTYHIDGLASDGEIHFVRASRYINSCLAFMHGTPLGSITVEDSHEQAAWAEFARRIIETMRLPAGAFHLEAFLTPEGERVFLEIACRPPGALIGNTLELVFGIDLRREHIKCQLGLLTEADRFETEGEYGAWLIFPMKYNEEGKRTSSSVRAFKTLSKTDLPTLHWCQFPAIDSPAENEFAYENNLGSFIFAGPDAIALEKDLRHTIETYNVEVT